MKLLNLFETEGGIIEEQNNMDATLFPSLPAFIAKSYYFNY